MTFDRGCSHKNWVINEIYFNQAGDEKEVEKQTENSKEADDVEKKADAPEEEPKEKEKAAKIPLEIVDENNADPLNDEDAKVTKDTEKDPLDNSDDERNDKDAGSGSEEEKDKEDDEKSEEEEEEEEDEESEEDDDKKSKGEGIGTPLGDITKIEASITRSKIDDLKILYKILFNNPGKINLIKKDLKNFSGFEFVKDSGEYKKKITAVEKLDIKHLKTVCDILELDKKGSKEEIAVRLCEFLVEPKETSEKNNSGGGGRGGGGDGRPKRSAAVKAKNRGINFSLAIGST